MSSQGEGKMSKRDERDYPRRAVTEVPQWQMPSPDCPKDGDEKWVM